MPTGAVWGVRYDVAAILTTLFMTFAVGYPATRSNIVPNTGDLRKSEVEQIFLVTALGLGTLLFCCREQVSLWQEDRPNGPVLLSYCGETLGNFLHRRSSWTLRPLTL
jgi:hypothetical protein